MKNFSDELTQLRNELIEMLDNDNNTFAEISEFIEPLKNKDPDLYLAILKLHSKVHTSNIQLRNHLIKIITKIINNQTYMHEKCDYLRDEYHDHQHSNQNVKRESILGTVLSKEPKAIYLLLIIILISMIGLFYFIDPNIIKNVVILIKG